jgi:hypothetical protein
LILCRRGIAAIASLAERLRTPPQRVRRHAACAVCVKPCRPAGQGQPGGCLNLRHVLAADGVAFVGTAGVLCAATDVLIVAAYPVHGRELVRSPAAEEVIRASSADERILLRRTSERVIANAAIEIVGASVSAQDICTSDPAKDVVTGEAADDIIAPRPDQLAIVVARSTDRARRGCCRPNLADRDDHRRSDCQDRERPRSLHHIFPFSRRLTASCLPPATLWSRQSRQLQPPEGTWPRDAGHAAGRAFGLPLPWAAVPKPRTVRVTQIADILGVTHQRTSVIVGQPGFPAPVAREGQSRVWSRREDVS